MNIKPKLYASLELGAIRNGELFRIVGDPLNGVYMVLVPITPENNVVIADMVAGIITFRKACLRVTLVKGSFVEE